MDSLHSLARKIIGRNESPSMGIIDSRSVKTSHHADPFFYNEGSRGQKVLTDFLGESEVKAIMTDGYNAYNFLDGTLSVDHLLCMAVCHCVLKIFNAVLL